MLWLAILPIDPLIGSAESYYHFMMDTVLSCDLNFVKSLYNCFLVVHNIYCTVSNTFTLSFLLVVSHE